MVYSLPEPSGEPITMKGRFYEFLLILSRFVGTWFIGLFAWMISSGYFLLSPGRVANSVGFYRAVFPRKKTGALLMLAWRQFHHFATVFVDRVRLETDAELICETLGMDNYEKHRAQGKGGIFLMSHFGNWEIAARHFVRKGTPLMLHLGQREQEQIEGKQKNDLAEAGVRILSGRDKGGAPFDLLESIHVLRQGGFVSIAGDRVQHNRQQQMEADFMGHRIRVPIAPYLLALLSRAPIFMLFTLRIRSGQYQVILEEPFYVREASGKNREAVLKQAIRRYLDRLEEMVRAHPEHWYHFEPFLTE